MSFTSSERLTGGEREVAAVVFSHVDVEATWPRDLLHLPLRARRSPEVLQSTHHLEHRSQRHPTGIFSKTSVRSHSVVDVRVERTVDADLVRRREDIRIAIRADLRSSASTPKLMLQRHSTYEAAEDFIPWLDVDGMASVVYSGCYLGLSVRPKGSIQANSFHTIMEYLLVRLRSVL